MPPYFFDKFIFIHHNKYIGIYLLGPPILLYSLRQCSANKINIIYNYYGPIQPIILREYHTHTLM